MHTVTKDYAGNETLGRIEFHGVGHEMGTDLNGTTEKELDEKYAALKFALKHAGFITTQGG